MKRAEILEAARKCVCGEREQDYGTPEDNFQTIAELWNAYLRRRILKIYHHAEGLPFDFDNVISPADVAVMMALLKVARISYGNAPDNFVDLAGYAACAGELAETN